jgi:hypothetical protein
MIAAMKTLTLLVLSLGCASKAAGPVAQPTPAAAVADPERVFGPLDVGADWKTYHKESTQPFKSKTHGGRWVEVYANDLAHGVYGTDGAFPEGAILVKTSLEDEGGKPGTTPGPIFVMRKQAPGYLPDHDDWYYAIHWEKPTEAQLAKLKGPIYWRGKSTKVAYCYDCHDNYDRDIGGTPAEFLVK